MTNVIPGPAVGDIVALTIKPPNVGGRGFRHLRYRFHGYDYGYGDRVRRAWVFGPLVHDPPDGWLPDPTRRVREYLVPLDTITKENTP